MHGAAGAGLETPRPAPIFEPLAVNAKPTVTESDGVYKLHAEIPGVKKDDIHISVDGDQVAISAEVTAKRITIQ